MMRTAVFALLFVLLCGVPLAAQESTPEMGEAMLLEVEAADGTILRGELWNAELNVQTPAVLLMHETDGTRQNWWPMLPALVEAGYRVVNVDLRGSGESEGQLDWNAAVGDVQTWLDWMRSQPSIRPDQIAIMGSSIGGNLALIGCANDGACVTAVALSPGLDYQGLMPEQFLIDNMATRSALLITSRGDGRSNEAVREFVQTATGDVGARIYMGSDHGTTLFNAYNDDLASLILYWLDTYIPR